MEQPEIQVAARVVADKDRQTEKEDHQKYIRDQNPKDKL